MIDNIDTGNSNLTDEEALNALKILKDYTDKTKKLSKY